MADQWYAIVDKATGRLFSQGTVIADAETLEKNGMAAIAVAFNPQQAPEGDPDGRYEWDEGTRQYVARSGADLRLTRLQSLRAQEATVEAEMIERGETVPERTTSR